MGAATVVVGVIVWVTWSPQPQLRWVSLAALAGILLVYALWVRRYVAPNAFDDTANRPVGTWYAQFTLAVLGGIGAVFSPNVLTVQAVLIPLIWVTSRSVRQAVIATTAIVSAMAAGYAIGAGLPGSLPQALIIQALSLAFAIGFGLWMTRVALWGEERQRLLSELQDAQERLELMHRDAGATAERERIARELHDTIAQSLTSVVMLAQRGRREAAPTATLELIESTAREALQETRALVAANAAPPAGSLAEALGRLGERFQRETGVAVTVHADAIDAPRDLEVVLLRCAQEALANVRKHAQAGTVALSLRNGEDFELIVADDGIGYRGLDLDDDRGFGLTGLRDRVRLVGGTLRIDETPGGGARLTVRVPKAAPQEQDAPDE